MALDENQLRTLRKDCCDEHLIDANFPEVLSAQEWEMAVSEVAKSMKGRSKVFLADQGVVWVEQGQLRTQRRRRRPLNDFGAGAIPILVLHKGSEWIAEPRLWYIAHKQLGIDPPELLPCGTITNEQLVKELKDKLQRSIRFAKPFVEPLQLPENVVRCYMENSPSTEESQRLQSAIKNAPRPKYPQRHVSAERLLYACEDLLKDVESCEASDSRDGLSHWCHLMTRFFEAGKAHAYLERDRDPQTLAENRQGARMIGTPMSRERRTMEEGCDEFERKHGRRPKSKELQAHLGVVIKKSSGSDGRDDELKFRGHKIARKDFQRRFDDIRRDRKNGKR